MTAPAARRHFPDRMCPRRRLSAGLAMGLLVVAGCASPGSNSLIHLSAPKVDMASGVPSVFTRGDWIVGIATVDERRDTTSDPSTQNHVGVIERGDEDVPLETLNRTPLAYSCTQAVAKAFTQAGYYARPVFARTDSPGLVPAGRMESLSVLRAVVVHLHEWNCDMSDKAMLTYDIEILVGDSAGNLLASDRVAGRDLIGLPGVPASLSEVQKQLPALMAAKLSALLASPRIIKAFQ